MSKLNRAKLEEMTVVELRELLQKQGLSTSGNKQTLVDRLLNANPTGAGVFVIEAVSSPRPKKDAAAPSPIANQPQTAAPESPQLSEAEVEAAAPEPTPVPDDAAAFITQLKDLIAQAQVAAEAAQKAQQAAEAAAASVKQKKEKKDKKGDKKKDKKKKD